MRLIRFITGLAAVAALAIPAGALAATPQRPDAGVVQTTDGEAGYFTQAFARTFTAVGATLSLNLPAARIGDGGMGIQACNSETGQAAQLGVSLVAGAWQVRYGAGTLAVEPPSTDPCENDGIVTVTSEVASGLSAVPTGDSIQASIRVVRGGLLFTAADLHAGTELTSFTVFVPGRYYFNEAAAGVDQDLTQVTACPPQGCGTDVTDLSQVTATSGGQSHGLAVWDAVEVESALDGSVFVAPTPLTPAAAIRTWHKAHWWCLNASRGICVFVPGHATWTGVGPSAFTLATGAPIAP